MARKPGTSLATHLFLPVGICLDLFSEALSSGSDLGLCEPEWLGLPTLQGKDGLEPDLWFSQDLMLEGSPPPYRTGSTSNSPNTRRRFRHQAGGAHSPCLLYLYPSDCQKCRLGPMMRIARLGKRPSACHSVHIDQQGDSTGQNQAACEVRPHALPHPQSVFSPRSTSSRQGEAGRSWVESRLALVSIALFHLAGRISRTMSMQDFFPDHNHICLCT